MDGFFRKTAMAGVRGACEGLFPENDLGAPDWKTTDMVRRTSEYFEELPIAQRRLLIALFVVVELGSIGLVFGFRRFSKMKPLERAAVVRRWRRSRLLLFRVLGDALKATTTIIYMSHPAAIEYIQAFKTCERPGDALPFPVRAGALAEVRGR